MGYELVDLILKQFSLRHGLHLYKRAKEDFSTRAFVFEKSRWELWMEEPDQDGRLVVNICRRGKKETIQQFEVTPESLADVLENCLQIIKANGGEADLP